MPNLLAWLILLSGSLAFSQVKFTSTAYTSGDIGTNSIANGDFNNDGILDLVTVTLDRLYDFNADGHQAFPFKGAGNAWNGAKRMELWIDGNKIGQNLEDQLKVTTSLALGKHTASFVVVDSFDNHVSGSVSFTAWY